MGNFRFFWENGCVLLVNLLYSGVCWVVFGVEVMSEDKDERKYFRILSIDGGGIRGIIPAKVLEVLEKKLQNKTGNDNARIADHFDLIAGTSTGGILTCVYLCPDSSGKRPKFEAVQAVEFYSEYGTKIFKSNIISNNLSLLRYPKHNPSNIESVLKAHLHDTRLKDLLKPCLITAYDIEAGETVFFTQHTVKPKTNYFVRDVARATSAAPTYFPPALIKPVAGKAVPLIDGGVFANNPAMCAFAEVQNKFRKGTVDTVMLSLGTGKYHKCFPYKKARYWGGVQWVSPLIDIMMGGVSETVDYQMRQLYESVERPDQYLRINPDLLTSMELDDASKANITSLEKLGEDTASENDAELDRFVNLLLA